MNHDRFAVVTGASSGIGRAVALALAARGHHVAVGYRNNAEGAKRTAAEAERHGVRALTFAADLADPRAAARAVDTAIRHLGGVDVLVNNAGVNRRAEFVEETLDDWERVLTVDLTSPFAIAQVAARHMIRQGRGGRIVNITSVHEHIPIRGGAAYCAAKGGLGLLTKVMALELAPYRITVNAVAPGETATPMNGVPEDRDAASIDRPEIPAGRPGRSEEVAALVAHLADPQAAYTTGISAVVDGGLSLMAAIPNQAYAGRL
ncbi:3-oxoacyl-(acyl-carrier protein) reductase [Carbonactinospora thermoautotrophica]|uniref:3-oxoacyl-(Acyl-carrier protein) reductase n=1 Tax=Carbonactinospora thermoautotrophica TaxID=1469144 RepID=A0A132MTG2_9ACTN|nr:SDR family oxidoreductase [Carbonactinospora thermoautotrophica]KWX01141.1 3-oxoacyl-(acyl-carrier protein) reductase [Carbonactinospora thermoautotrophica]